MDRQLFIILAHGEHETPDGRRFFSKRALVQALHQQGALLKFTSELQFAVTGISSIKKVIIEKVELDKGHDDVFFLD